MNSQAELFPIEEVDPHYAATLAAISDMARHYNDPEAWEPVPGQPNQERLKPEFRSRP